MKKILVVAPDFFPSVSGYSNAVTNMCMALASTNKYNINVLIKQNLLEVDEININNLNIHRIPSFKFKGIIGFRFFFRIVGVNKYFEKLREDNFWKEYFRKNKYDIILFETFESADLSLKIIKHSGYNYFQYMIRIHGAFETELFAFNNTDYCKRMYKNAKELNKKIGNILFTTPHYIDFYKKYFFDRREELNYFDKNIAILPNFVSYLDVKGIKIPDEINSLIGKEDIFLTLGRWDEQGYQQKNFRLIAFAVSFLKINYPEISEKIKIIIIGTGDKKNDFLQMTEVLKIQKNFIIYNKLENSTIRKMQNIITATILVSKYEGHSMFVAEALSSGSPLIVSSNSGVSHLVQNNENGYVINDYDYEGLAHSIIRILNCNISEMKNKSLEIYNQKYSNDVLLKKADIIFNLFSNTK